MSKFIDSKIIKMNSKLKEGNWIKGAKCLFVIGGLVLLITLGIVLNQYFKILAPMNSKIASELGSFISGFVGIFWSGAGVILIYATFQEQKKLFVNQQFESSFFKLLDTYNSLLNSMRLNLDGQENLKTNEKIGRECLAKIWEIITNGLNDKDMLIEWAQKERKDIREIKMLLQEHENLSESIITIENYIENPSNRMWRDRSDKFLLAQFEYHSNKYKNQIIPYCRFVFNIFKYLEEQNEDEKSARRYIKLLQAQMSEEEFSIIFFYAKNNDRDFLNLLNKYEFFENNDETACLQKLQKQK